MIDGGEGTIGSTDTAGGEAKALKGLRGCYFVNEVTIDVEKGRHAIVFDYVIVPDFIVEGTWSFGIEGCAGGYVVMDEGAVDGGGWGEGGCIAHKGKHCHDKRSFVHHVMRYY